MCIRDSGVLLSIAQVRRGPARQRHQRQAPDYRGAVCPVAACLLYTSDAADERSSVDLGGRRIIKKKKKITKVQMRILIRSKK